MESSSGSSQDDYRRLESPDHFLGWLPGASPGQTLRDALQEDLARQVPGSQIEWLQFVDDPAFLTGMVESPGDSDPDPGFVRMTLRRAALAAPIAFSVVTPEGHRYVLKGVYTWVAQNLDTPWDRRDLRWLDLDWTRDQAAKVLKQRIYESDED